MKRSQKTRKRPRRKVTKKRTRSRQTMPKQQEKKGASHYHPELYQLVTRHFTFCRRLDLAMKLTLGGVFLALLLSMASLKTSVICLGVLVALRTLLQLLKSAAKQFWKGGVPKSTTFRLKKLPPHEVQLGKFVLTTVSCWITECCKKLSMPVPTKLVVHESKYSNAFAWQQRFLFFMKQNEVHVLSSLFDMLQADELQAVLCHELAHLKSHFPLVNPFIQLSLFLFSRFSSYPSYRWCLEYLADYAAVDVVGVAPTANCLIKLHHRGHLIQEIWKGLQEVLRDYQLSTEDIQELNTILEHALPTDLKSEQEVTSTIEQIIDQYVTERSGKIKKMGKRYTRRYTRKRSSHHSALSKQYRLIDWTVFDNKIRNNYLDEEELEDLYLALKKNRNARLFWSDILQHEEMEKFLSHPPLRKRIIFAVESIDRDWINSAENPSLSDEYAASFYCQWWTQLEPEWQQILRNAVKMADQPTDVEFVRLRNLKSLNCDSTTITDLTPLRMLPNLRELDCSRTSITNLQPVQYLSNLRTLCCANTNITDLEPLRRLTKLERLWCNHTQVRSVEPLRYLTGLQEVHCDHTCVESLKPLQDLPHLKELRCQDISELHELDTLLESLR